MSAICLYRLNLVSIVPRISPRYGNSLLLNIYL